MTFDKFHPYVLVQITDDDGTVRDNQDTSQNFPFPLDINSVELSKSVSQKSQTFRIKLDNPVTSGTWPTGKYENLFNNLNNNVEIEIGTGSPGTKQLVGNINFFQKTLKRKLSAMEFKGRDRTDQLHNLFINFKRFSSGTDYAFIVRDLIFNHETDVKAPTSTAPNTGLGITENKTFSRQPIFEVISELAGEINYDFWVDTDGNLNFQKRGNVENVEVLDTSKNILELNTSKDVDKTKNEIWIYGGRITAETRTVQDETHTFRTSVDKYFLGQLHIGSITAVSGTLDSSDFVFRQPNDYQLDSNNWTLSWSSAGSKPDVDTTYNVTYQYTPTGRVVLVKVPDPELQRKHGRKTRWLRKDEIAENASGATIKDRYDSAINQAKALARGVLKQLKEPKEEAIVKLDGFVQLDLGERITLHAPEHNIINDGDFRIKEINYSYNKVTPFVTRVILDKITIGEAV